VDTLAVNLFALNDHSLTMIGKIAIY